MLINNYATSLRRKNITKIKMWAILLNCNIPSLLPVIPRIFATFIVDTVKAALEHKKKNKD